MCKGVQGACKGVQGGARGVQGVCKGVQGGVRVCKAVLGGARPCVDADLHHTADHRVDDRGRVVRA